MAEVGTSATAINYSNLKLSLIMCQRMFMYLGESTRQ